MSRNTRERRSTSCASSPCSTAACRTRWRICSSRAGSRNGQAESSLAWTTSSTRSMRRRRAARSWWSASSMASRRDCRSLLAMGRVYGPECPWRLDRPPCLGPKEGERQTAPAEKPERETAGEPRPPAEGETGHGRTGHAPVPPDLQQVDTVRAPVVPELPPEPVEIAPVVVPEARRGLVAQDATRPQQAMKDVQIAGPGRGSADVERGIEAADRLQSLAPERHVGPDSHVLC